MLGTPGVYIEEMNAFPNSVVSVATAVPVFIGYTQTASYNNKSLLGIPTRINSLLEYEACFGKGFNHIFSLDMQTAATVFNDNMLKAPAQFFYFYNCLRLFYANGGGNCYIVSVGTYGDDENKLIDKADFLTDALWNKLEQEAEPTLVLLPDMVNRRMDAYEVYKKALLHCQKMQSRLAVFDVIPDAIDKDNDETVAVFRAAIGNDALSYGAAYYPWLNTNIVNESSFKNLQVAKNDLYNFLVTAAGATTKLTIDAQNATERKNILAYDDKAFHHYLIDNSVLYQQITKAIDYRLSQLPPASGMAGVYALVDSSRGVWKAPANISLNGVISPAVNISSDEQSKMNIDSDEGKSINCIRSFAGKGTLVWGARTLDGNSNEWRYISVRRTIMMVEQSVKLACKAFVFEPNVSATWITMRGMIENYLTNLWRQGALQGAKPEAAFFVHIGLGTTMTATDILEGNLIVEIKLAIVRPAEFIIITFRQQQQKS